MLVPRQWLATISDVTLGTAIVMMHQRLAEHLRMRERVPSRADTPRSSFARPAR